MELEELVKRLQDKLDDVDLALDSADRKKARECLREAKKLLDDEFLAEKADWHGG